MTEQKIGDIIDRLGVTADIDDDELVVSAVVLLKVLPPDSGRAALTIVNSESMDAIEQMGILATAMNVVTHDQWEQRE